MEKIYKDAKYKNLCLTDVVCSTRIYFPNLNTALLISFYHHDKTLSPKPTGNGWADSSRSQHYRENQQRKLDSRIMTDLFAGL